MGFRSIPEKDALQRPLWPDYGHYMGLNLAVFSQMEQYLSPDFSPG